MLEPYWDSFGSLETDELDGRRDFHFRLKGSGKWRFLAMESPDRDRINPDGTPYNRKHIVYDPYEDTLTYSDPEIGESWEMTDVFGIDTLASTNRGAP